MSRPRVVVLEAPGAAPWPGLEPLAAEAALTRAADRAALLDAARAADIIVATDFRTPWLEEAVAVATRLSWVHATSAGIDAVMVPALVASDAVVTNARGIFDQSIAEHVMGVILAFAKDLHRTFELQRQRCWKHRESERVAGQRLLVVIAAPLTDETRGMVGRDELRRMKPSARLINVGRGPIVRTADLLEALASGEIAGAALDVFEEEPLPADHPLWERPEVILTSHMAGDFVGWRRALSEQLVALFRAWRAGGPLWNVVAKKVPINASRPEER
jgi:phosphoglycerate dehydrogenase-like enzyme